MARERALKVVLAVAGLLFVATVYPMLLFVRQEPALAMMLSLYVTLGVFLLLAVRRPAEHRSLIAFTAWSSFVHAGLMVVQVSRHMIAHTEMFGVWVLAAIGVLLVALGPQRGVVAPVQREVQPRGPWLRSG